MRVEELAWACTVTVGDKSASSINNELIKLFRHNVELYRPILKLDDKLGVVKLVH